MGVGFTLTDMLLAFNEWAVELAGATPVLDDASIQTKLDVFQEELALGPGDWVPMGNRFI